MLLALVCLWIGFVAGLVCAALMRGEGNDNRLPAQRTSETTARHLVTRHPYRRRAGQEETRADEREEI
jgi:hypothetical protein